MKRSTWAIILGIFLILFGWTLDSGRVLRDINAKPSLEDWLKSASGIVGYVVAIGGGVSKVISWFWPPVRVVEPPAQKDRAASDEQLDNFDISVNHETGDVIVHDISTGKIIRRGWLERGWVVWQPRRVSKDKS